MTRDTVRQWANLFAALVALVVNILANALPLNGLNTAKISDMLQIFFVPAGYVFSIWGLIYIGWIAFLVYQMLPAQRDNPRLRRLGYLFALSSLFNAAWLFCWHYLQFGLSVLVMLILLSLLIASYLRLDVGRAQASRLEKWCVDATFSVYLGWITVATVANISGFLYSVSWNGLGIAGEVWAVIMLAVACVLGIGMLVNRRDTGYLFVLVWAFIGIAVKQSGVALVATAAWVAAVLALVLAVTAIVQRRSSVPTARPAA